MKIGVALSGCDIGGVCGYRVLKRLEAMGFEIEMVSTCCLASAMALAYGCGLEAHKADLTAAAFLQAAREENMDAAIAAVDSILPPGRLAQCKALAVNAVQVESGKVFTFTNAFRLKSERLCTLPLRDGYDALSATISTLDGLASYRYRGLRLCDYSAWYGCPLYPLRMSGIPRVLSISFLPLAPSTPYEILVRQTTLATAGAADVHISVEFPAGELLLEEYDEIAAERLESFINQLYFSALA